MRCIGCKKQRKGLFHLAKHANAKSTEKYKAIGTFANILTLYT